MITIKDLIQDEREAIANYRVYLSQMPLPRKDIEKINKIILDELNHIKILKK